MSGEAWKRDLSGSEQGNGPDDPFASPAPLDQMRELAGADEEQMQGFSEAWERIRSLKGHNNCHYDERGWCVICGSSKVMSDLAAGKVEVRFTSGAVIGGEISEE